MEQEDARDGDGDWDGARAGTGTEKSRVPAVPERNYHD